MENRKYDTSTYSHRQLSTAHVCIFALLNRAWLEDWKVHNYAAVPILHFDGCSLPLQYVRSFKLYPRGEKAFN